MGLFKNKSYFYHSHIRRMIAAFGYVFSDISIARFNSEGGISSMITLPIILSNTDVDLSLNREKVNSKDDKHVSSGFKEEFPRLTYTMDNIQFNPDRHKSRNCKIRWTDTNTGRVKSVESSTPYIANFTLNIIAKNHIDAMQVFEQIAPAFRPSITLKMKDHPIENCEYDMPISLVSTSIEDNYDSGIDEKRRVVYRLEFEVLFHMYGPTGSRLEYDALLLNLQQVSGCEELDNNDLNNLRGKNSELDNLLLELDEFEQDTEICEIVIKSQAFNTELITDPVTGYPCYETELVDLDIENIEFETKVVEK